ncbi:hypothetical protein Tco_0809417 [Tanacetum coccineum]
MLSMKKRLRKKESISKQGRKNAKSKPTLDAFDDLDVDLAHGMDYMETKEAVNEGRQSNETEELNLEVDTARLDVDAARQEVNAVETRTPPTTTSIFDDEDITMTQTLIKMKEEKAKEKGVAFKDVKDSSRPARSVLTLKQLPSIGPKDKGKELAEIARIQEEKAAQEEASRVALIEMFDEVQAGIDADALQKKIIDDFKPMDSDDASKDSKKAVGDDTSKKEEVLKEPDSTKIESINKEDARKRVLDVSKKRKGGPRMKRMSKRKKTESNLEEEEDLKNFLKIVPDKEGMIDYEVLEKRFPIIN